MTQLSKLFDYSVLDNNTARFLQDKEIRMSQIVGQAYTDLGKELKEAQDELAKRGYGCFYEWFESLGFKKDQVYRWIGRYELIVANCDKRELIEELPVSLTYELAKPSANPEAVQAVLNGEISTHKEFKKLEKALEEERRLRAKAEATAESERNSARHFENLWNKAKNQPPVIKTETKVIEKVPEDYHDLKEQAVIAQRLNSENVQLKRTIDEQKQRYESMLKSEDNRKQAIKELKKMCGEMLGSFAQYRKLVMMSFQVTANDREAYQIFDVFAKELDQEVRLLFDEIKNEMAIKAV